MHVFVLQLGLQFFGALLFEQHRFGRGDASTGRPRYFRSAHLCVFLAFFLSLYRLGSRRLVHTPASQAIVQGDFDWFRLFFFVSLHFVLDVLRFLPCFSDHAVLCGCNVIREITGVQLHRPREPRLRHVPVVRPRPRPSVGHDLGSSFQAFPSLPFPSSLSNRRSNPDLPTRRKPKMGSFFSSGRGEGTPRREETLRGGSKGVASHVGDDTCMFVAR